ncbi:MAG: MATE family efflux transporter [Hyphomicrobiales bacterium]
MQSDTGTLQVTNKAVLAIAIPMALGYLTTPLVGIADTAIVGQLGSASLIGGVAVAAVFVGLLLTTLNFLRFATSALIAQAVGRGDSLDVVGVLLRSCLIAVIAGVCTILIAQPLLSFGLWIMQPSDAVSSAASDYFLIRILAAPFTLLNFVFFAWALGTGRPILSFLLQSFLNITNIILSYYLVLTLDMGIKGAALGTVIAEIVTVALTLFFVIKPVLAQRPHLVAITFNAAKLKRMILLNSDIMVRSFCLFAAFAFFTRQSAQQSDAILAANEILLHFFMIAGYFLDGFAVAVEQFIGRAIGARSRDTFQRAIRVTSVWNFAQALALSIIFLIFGTWMVEFMTPNDEIRITARGFMLWAALTPVIGVAAFQMDGIFIGATWSKDMRNSMLTSLILMIACYYVFFPLIGNHGLWLALSIFLGLRALTLYILLKKREKNLFAPGPTS